MTSNTTKWQHKYHYNSRSLTRSRTQPNPLFFYLSLLDGILENIFFCYFYKEELKLKDLFIVCKNVVTRKKRPGVSTVFGAIWVTVQTSLGFPIFLLFHHHFSLWTHQTKSQAKQPPAENLPKQKRFCKNSHYIIITQSNLKKHA